MNILIYNFILERLHNFFSLPKYGYLNTTFNEETRLWNLPWTSKRLESFENSLYYEFSFRVHEHPTYSTMKELVKAIDRFYMGRFFGTEWKPRTDTYQYSGSILILEVNNLHPRSVLDVGCGYHPFKGKIENLTGIDPYNAAADYMVDVLDYNGSHDVILALGSINFNSLEDVEERFAKCVSILDQGGKFFLRANPGIPHKAAPFVSIFPWDFSTVQKFARTYNLHLDSFKKDSHDRLFFSYTKV